MKIHKLFLLLGLVACGAQNALFADDITDAIAEGQSDAVVLTDDEQAACQNIQQLWIQKYIELGTHQEVTDAMQTIADDNRDDFEVLLQYYGENVQDEQGNITRVVIVPTYFVIR